jgi:hypothetical protein
MKILRRLFSKRPEINAASAKIDDMVYLLNYERHYADTLTGLGESRMRPEVLAELFLFRAWTTQFGYRVFCSDKNASEKLIGETVNSTKYLGLGMFRKVHGFSVEDTLGADYMSLVEDRWRNYDLVVSTHTGGGIPTMELMAELTRRLGVADAAVTYQLSIDFLGQLDQIKKTAIELGVLG